jgi:hypothetical protein
MDVERSRLEETRRGAVSWKRWGPYLSERQWGTVREDYSETGDAWNYLTHDQARSRAYRWGEDGIAGISDEKQRLCFALALWNGVDPILKERLFGLSNGEGNHGEDVKEYYFYLDSTPTHSYMKYLYKYPQRAYPYDDLVRTSAARSRAEPEYELIDTGIFEDDRYFDVFVEYAKASAEDLLIDISVHNRGPDTATLHLLPTLWFRNTWSWSKPGPKPELRAVDGRRGTSVVVASHAELGKRWLVCEGGAPFVFTENETNRERVFGSPNTGAFVKDGIHDYLIGGRAEAVNSDACGTKTAALVRLEIAGGGCARLRLRLTDRDPGRGADPFDAGFDETFALRRHEADAFYEPLLARAAGDDARNVMRQAFAGMLWSKQYYLFDVDRWLDEHDAHPMSGGQRKPSRNREWFHMVNDDIISMPDKWEYPWYAAWDLAFHTAVLWLVDPDFAKNQLELMLRDVYLHPSGQLPAYEWNFGDVNPPVHAWATLFVYNAEKQLRGQGDVTFLKGAFHKLLMNFTWWVNRKDPTGKNVFQGGFLGLDNIGVFDRSAPLPTGGSLEQADGTAWMALFCQNMLEISLELAQHDPSYEDMAVKFFEHFLWVAAAMDRIGDNQDEMWDEEDGFFYDLLRLPDGQALRLKVRSLVGLLPLCAVTVFSEEILEKYPRLRERARRFLAHHPELTANIAPPGRPGLAGRHMLAVLDEAKLRRVLSRMLDENEFLGPHGIRSISRHHLAQPYVLRVGDHEHRVGYEPAESSSGLFGGNSNWRGPVWFPLNVLIVRALLQLHSYYGDAFTIECPSGSGRSMDLFEVSQEIGHRLLATFLRDAQGRRPVYGATTKFQIDPHWRDLILFYEYFHGDNGAGIGASHQTGWTGLIGLVGWMLGSLKDAAVLREGARAATTRAAKESMS